MGRSSFRRKPESTRGFRPKQRQFGGNGGLDSGFRRNDGELLSTPSLQSSRAALA